MNIDLGCGESKQPGWVGIDARDLNGVDIVCDLNKGIPIEDDTVDIVKASHILEHIPDTIKIMSEIWRVCKNNSQVAIAVPHYKSIGAWQDPTHVKAFTEHTFWYFDPAHPLYNVYKLKSQFKVEHLEWQTTGNMEVLLRCLKNGEYKETQAKALKREGCKAAVKNGKRKKKSQVRPRKKR
jgi:predicted SAM-dependent methyltransferase